MPRPLFAIATLMLFAAADLPAQDWTALFDGRTLDGWTPNENPGSFQVLDGELVVKGERGHLFYSGPVAEAAFENFEFEAEVLTKPGANSGIYFHTKSQASGWPDQGYEVQINSSHTDTIRTGSLYGVVNVSERHSKDDEWFKVRLVVRRKNVAVFVGGKRVVNYNEAQGRGGGAILGKGTFAIQAHDPGSEVHYKNLRVRLLPATRPVLSRAERHQLEPDGEWWDRMDYGPALACTVGIRGRSENVALKGVTVSLGGDPECHFTFDTELLRPAAAFEKRLALTGVTFDGSHAGHPTTPRQVIFETPQAPGFSHAGGFADPRPIPFGPLPRAVGRYLGLYRSGESVVFSYTAGGAKVLEAPARENSRSESFITRTLALSPCSVERDFVLADAEDATLHIVRGDRHASLHPPPIVVDGDEVMVLVDRTPKGFEGLSMGAPSDRDAANGEGARITFEPSMARPHPKVRVVGGELVGLNDGVVQRNADDPGRSTFFDGGSGRVTIDLLAVKSLTRISTYSWHKSDRGPQRFTLWASPLEQAPATTGDLTESGWVRLANVDSSVLGQGGTHGSSVHRGGKSIGSFRRLLFDLLPSENNQGIFLSEIDVWAEGREPAAFSPLASGMGQNPLGLVITDGPPEWKLVQALAAGRRVVALRVPASAARSLGRVALVRMGKPELAASAASTLPPLADPERLTLGGHPLWPVPVVTQGVMAKNDATWVVDDVPVPFENPWGSEMRVGAFDFFSDATRAAVCTWNGDVWIVSGLDGTLGKITWKRFAAGLFETLGLRIVDDIVHVNGRDQITRLHDLNADGEADFYECFNNDVYATRNFHEFVFDLQTDAEGNFYFSKGAPVRGGGRGFDHIVPHHGTVMKVTKKGDALSVVSTGMRAPNGIGVGPNGELTAGDNEGTWVPHCKLHWLKPGSFQGVIPTAHREETPATFNPPLCWFPMEVDNSGGSQVWVPDERFGLGKGELLHLSYGQSSIYRVFRQDAGGIVQGGVWRLPVRLASSAMRARFNPKDGQLWVSGLKGWQTNAAKLSGFQRIRYTGQPVVAPAGISVTSKGLELRFSCALDPELANDPESYAIEQWNYVWGPQYGSPEVSLAASDPAVLEKAQKTEMHDHKKHDPVAVRSATLSADGRTVLLTLDGLKPVMQMHIKVDLETADKKPLKADLYNTVNVVPDVAHD